ncbi:protein kinase family protein [Streptomyces litchfieldiae]|uniref:Protein kinase family protein n=1 Tax=Streptomyces litchfieldiae TaxID=3075543 RepID=A0ABU2MKM1_9ACTN|nr:protein kinase family protein [Streptomyces sp. DSM 44938]MDT0342155.1 protein kinase family protein [Streptomyces sp. DSM 44938]
MSSIRAENGEAGTTVAERSTATSSSQRPASAQHATDPEGTETVASPAGKEPAESTPVAATPSPELHSGHRLAKRYRLEECITRLDGFSSWRAVDEKLRRAVGIHVLPATHERARAVLSAARSTALLGDLRFVQVLDAVEENGQVHVVHEWLSDAVPLSTVLHNGPLDAHEAYALAGQVAQAMAAAHRKDLAHLRLTPATVLRTGPGQFRIRGLAVDAALRGITSADPRRADTEAIGALLYAALTQRWPYGEGAYGLSGVAGLSKGSRDSLATPEQVRAGIHRGLSELAMRALDNNGATATSQEPPFTSPEELSQALAALPRIPPPDPTPTALAGFQHTTFQRGTLAAGRTPVAAPARTAPTPAAPPALPGRTGTVLKWGVSALLIAALGLGSWQLADALLKGDSPAEAAPPTAPPEEQEEEPPAPGPVEVTDITEFDPEGTGSGQNPESAPAAIDGDPGTFWHTKNYYGPSFGNLKEGLGLILDLGEAREISSVTVETIGETTVEFRAAGPEVTEMPDALDAFPRLAEGTGESLTLRAEESIKTRFVLVWLTELPQGDDGNYRGHITDITVGQ